MAGSQTPRGGIIEGINVTPLVDIMLVLLIIFMVTAKLVVNPAVPLDLPAASTGEDLQTIFAVSIAKDGKVLVDGKELSDAQQLGAHAREALAKDKELRAVIQADGDVSHRRVGWCSTSSRPPGSRAWRSAPCRPREPRPPCPQLRPSPKTKARPEARSEHVERRAAEPEGRRARRADAAAQVLGADRRRAGRRGARGHGRRGLRARRPQQPPEEGNAMVVVNHVVDLAPKVEDRRSPAEGEEPPPPPPPQPKVRKASCRRRSRPRPRPRRPTCPRASRRPRAGRPVVAAEAPSSQAAFNIATAPATSSPEAPRRAPEPARKRTTQPGRKRDRHRREPRAAGHAAATRRLALRLAARGRRHRRRGGLCAIKVSVSPDGSVADVQAVSDPGFGFGRRAMQCARTRVKFEPALDSAGRPIRARRRPCAYASCARSETRFAAHRGHGVHLPGCMPGCVTAPA